MSGQSPQFSQFYATAVYLNPALTGNTEINRLAGNYRKQWPGIPGAFTSYSIAYDYNWSALNTGLGFMATRDEAGSGGLKYTSFSGLVSHKFQVRENMWANAGMSFGIGIRSANVADYLFSDQIVSGGGATNESIASSKSFGDINAGVVVYGLAYWGGLSAYHLNRPNESLVDDQSSKVPTQWSLHGGYKFVIEESNKGVVRRSFTPTVNYKFSAKFDQLDIGAYTTQNKLLIGVWYRGLPLKRFQKGFGNSDAMVVMLGLKFNAFQVGYSYDFTTSKLSLRESNGSHEIAMVYEWPTNKRKKKKKRKAFIVPCPKF